MNDLEHRLHAALRDAVPDPVVPAGLLTAASRRAVRIRHRRVAAGGAVGAAAVVATGGVVARLPAAAPSAMLATASPTASATPPATASPAAPGLTVTITRVPCVTPPAPAAECSRFEVAIDDDRVTAAEDTHALRAAVEGTTWEPPLDVGFTFKDGTQIVVPLRQVSETRWVGEVPGRRRADVATFRVPGSGEPVEVDRVPAPATSAPS